MLIKDKPFLSLIGLPYKGLLLTIAALFLFGCSQPDCSDQMSEIKNQKGEPEEVKTYDSPGYHNIDWWYWSRGFEYSFTWGDNIQGCDISVYTFDPIQKLTSAAKSRAEQIKSLSEKYFCPNTPF